MCVSHRSKFRERNATSSKTWASGSCATRIIFFVIDCRDLAVFCHANFVCNTSSSSLRFNCITALSNRCGCFSQLLQIFCAPHMDSPETKTTLQSQFSLRGVLGVLTRSCRLPHLHIGTRGFALRSRHGCWGTGHLYARAPKFCSRRR